MAANTAPKPWYEMGFGLRARFRPYFHLLRHLPGPVSDWPYANWIAQRRDRELGLTLAAFDRHVSQLGAGSLAIDCGANVGDVTARLAATGAQVHAFEPEPYLFSLLVKRFAGVPNVSLHNAAVAARAGRLRLWLEDDPARELSELNRHSILRSPNADRGTQHVEVDCVDLLDFVAGLGRKPDLVKIDIEGAEVEILERLLAEDRFGDVGAMFVETHECQMPELRHRIVRIFREIDARKLESVNLLWP